MQAFAQETDCSPSKKFNSGSQKPTQFPTNKNSCPQPTRNQSSIVAENIHLQNPQYIYATNADQVTEQKIVVLPSEHQNPELFQQLNNSLFPQYHNHLPNKTTLQFSSLPTQSYTQRQTNEQPVAQLRSQTTVLPKNLQNYQSQTAPDFPASSMPFGANVPNFVDSQTQSNAKQNQFYHPNKEPSNLIANNSHASASIANFNPLTLLTKLEYKHSIKLPPLKIQNLNEDPLHFHECINNLYSMIHHNTSITDTHRITYLQNSVRESQRLDTRVFLRPIVLPDSPKRADKSLR